MIKNTLNQIFIILFMIILLLPLALANQGGSISEQENRILAEYPPISHMFDGRADYIRQLDAWFADNVGFREQSINLYKIIETLGSMQQQRDGQYIYLIGRQGHEYFGDDGKLIEKFQGKDFLTDDQLFGLAKRLDEIGRYLDGKGVPSLVMICPDKESVYPEYYPRSVIRGPEPIQLDRIIEYLKSNTSVHDVYSIKDRLISEKENWLVYNKAYVRKNIRPNGDLTHYNQIGAFCEYLELMKHIQVYFPDMEPFTFMDVDVDHLADFGQPTVTLRHDASFKQLDSSFFDDVDVLRPFTWNNRAFENGNLNLPTALVMRDSFANLWAEYLACHFSKTILIHWQNMKWFEDYVDLYQPDIVVFEIAERQLPSFADTVIRSR